jgi:hypothetical protein
METIRISPSKAAVLSAFTILGFGAAARLLVCDKKAIVALCLAAVLVALFAVLCVVTRDRTPSQVFWWDIYDRWTTPESTFAERLSPTANPHRSEFQPHDGIAVKT